MKIKTNSFCSISRTKDWQDFLKSCSEKLYDDLTEHLKSASCRSAKEKMISIYNKLIELGFSSKLEMFLLKRFPWIIEESKKPENVSINSKIKVVHSDDLIFKNYRPNMLTFPHRLIIESDDENELNNYYTKFVSDKCGVDNLILNNRMYIEYFNSQYCDDVLKIDKDNREISIFRKNAKN